MKIVAIIEYVMKNPTRVIGRRLAKHPLISRFAYWLYCLIPKIVYSFFCILPIVDKKVVLCNFCSHGGYGDHAKYLAQELLKENYCLVWLVGKSHYNDVDFPYEIKKVHYGSIKSLYELSTAQIWIDNQRKNSNIWKRKKQFYLQTWHAGYTIKKTSDDIACLVNPAQLDMMRYDGKMTDVVTSNSQIFTETYRNGFHYDGEILDVGFPRNDIFFLSNKELQPLKRKILEYISLSSPVNKEIHILLYAPTFRSTFKPEVYNIDYSACLSTLEKRFGGCWICLVRLHPIVSVMSNLLSLDVPGVYNVSSYPDAQEILSVCDMVITDYSTIIFDFALSRKPGLLYTPDLEEYAKPPEPGFAVDIETLPFLRANTNPELIEVLASYNYEAYVQRLNKFFEETKCTDTGIASKKCVERIELFRKSM